MEKKKDLITALHLFQRIKRSADIATWANNRKITEFYMILRDKAVVSWESLEDDNLNQEDWDISKRQFLKTYKPKYSAHKICANFADLIQKPGKTCKDYHVWLQTAYKCLTDNHPYTMAAVRFAGAIPD